MSCSFQHQSIWVWDLEKFFPTDIWKVLRPFHLFCSVTVSYSVPNVLPSWDWNFLMYLIQWRAFEYKMPSCAMQRDARKLQTKWTSVWGREAYNCWRLEYHHQGWIQSSWYSVSFLQCFCWIFLTSFKVFMYVVSVCAHGGLHVGSQTYSSLFVITF